MNAPSDQITLPHAEDACDPTARIHRQVFIDSPDFISYCRLGGNYIDVNPAFERFVGLPRERIIGRTALEIGLWGSAEERADFIRELQAHGRLTGYHRRLLRSNGEARDIEGWASIVREDGEEMLVAIGRDITDRKRAESELKQYRDELEKLVAQRTYDLTEANRALHAANEAKRSFMASMSHELRTPLNAILGYAQLLQMGSGLTERQIAGLSTIEQGGQHLLALITDILDLARVEAGKLVLQPGPIDLRAFVALVVDIMRVRAHEKALRFHYEPSPDLPRSVLADEQRLRQILLNLLGNAVKFTDDGEVTLRVHAEPRGAAARLRFAVADSGVGIAPEHRSRLFRPFEQVSETRHRVGGAGLGLSISQALAQLMGGRIAVESAPGQGSCFTLELTLPTPDAVVVAPKAARRATGYLGKRKHALIVDDVRANRTMLADMLQGLGFDTLEACDGREALAACERMRPDLILMDIVMPVMGGLDAMRHLRETPGFAAVPIIAVSASVTAGHERDCLAAGASAYVPKPIDASKLLAAIGAQLSLEWVYGDSAISGAGVLAG